MIAGTPDEGAGTLPGQYETISAVMEEFDTNMSDRFGALRAYVMAFGDGVQETTLRAQEGGGNGGGNNIDADITALLQALARGNTKAVNDAVTTLGSDVHAAAPAADGGLPHFAHIDLHHMWA